MELVAGKRTALILTKLPKEITVDGRASAMTEEVINGLHYVTIQQCPPGERHVAVKW